MCSRPSSGHRSATARLVGVIVSLGGQTPLQAGRRYSRGTGAGHSPSSIDLAEDRERWNDLCSRLGVPQPPGGTATTRRPRRWRLPGSVGYPVLVRPSYVLGGRAMEIVYDGERLVAAVEGMSGVVARWAARAGVTKDRPVLVDRFLEDAVEVDVDAVRDATGGGGHLRGDGTRGRGRGPFGDSACALSPTDAFRLAGRRARAAGPDQLLRSSASAV